MRQLTIGMLAIAMMALASTAGAQDNDTDNATHTATGCLRKSAVAHVYMLTDENGKMWDLHSKGVSLGTKVGHTVTVTGTIPPEPKESADTAPQNHLVVTKVDVVRDNCQQP